MRKVIFLATLVGGLVGLLRPQLASAQTKPIYAVKFVCGIQVFTGTPPKEPSVKRGNYATKINVETLTPALTGSITYSWNVSIPNHGASASQFVGSGRFLTDDITCVSIVARAIASGLFPNGAPQFINGYVNILPSTGAALAVTGVYTSQGCHFADGEPPICAGPVSIEVVPETALAFTPPPT